MVILLYFSFFLARQVKHRYVMDRFIPYVENRQRRDLINKLRKENLSQKKIYVLGNQTEIYYFLNSVSITYFPHNFPWISNYFNSEQRIISDIKKNRVDCIIIPLPLDENYIHFNSLLAFINKNYSEKANKNKEYRLFYIKIHKKNAPVPQERFL